MIDYFRSHYGVSLHARCENYVYGLLSGSENETIRRGANEVLDDYLLDVVDRDGAPMMALRDGGSRPVEPGSWFVNCTGYVFKRQVAYSPYVSEKGAVVSVDLSSAITFLSTIGAYLLTHVAFLDRFDLPLYEMDMNEVRSKVKPGMPWIAAAHMMYNVGTIAAEVPRYVMAECGVDMDRWYPLPRRLMVMLAMQFSASRDQAHFKRTLDRVREKHGIRCGPLPST